MHPAVYSLVMQHQRLFEKGEDRGKDHAHKAFAARPFGIPLEITSG